MTTLILGPNGSGKSAYAESLAARLRDRRAMRLRDGRISRLRNERAARPQDDGCAACPPCGRTARPQDRCVGPSPMYYFATMIPYGEEGRARVEKHRRQRASAGFITVERPVGVSGVQFPPDAVALLEDVSNLLGNTLFGGVTSVSAACDVTPASTACDVTPASTGAPADVTTAPTDAAAAAPVSAAAAAEDSVFNDIAALCEKCADAVLVSIDGLDASEPGYDDETRGYIGALNRLNARLIDLADTVVAMRAGNPEYIKCSGHSMEYERTSP